VLKSTLKLRITKQEEQKWNLNVEGYYWIKIGKRRSVILKKCEMRARIG